MVNLWSAENNEGLGFRYQCTGFLTSEHLTSRARIQRTGRVLVFSFPKRCGDRVRRDQAAAHSSDCWRCRGVGGEILGRFIRRRNNRCQVCECCRKTWWSENRLRDSRGVCGSKGGASISAVVWDRYWKNSWNGRGWMVEVWVVNRDALREPWAERAWTEYGRERGCVRKLGVLFVSGTWPEWMTGELIKTATTGVNWMKLGDDDNWWAGGSVPVQKMCVDVAFIVTKRYS